MKLIKAGLVITILALGFNLRAPAALPLLKVVTEEFPPYNYTVDGKIKGIATTVVTETLKRADIKYSLKVYPWKRGYRAIALFEKNVLIYSIYQSPERVPLFAAWIGPILPPAAVFFYKLKSRSDINVSTLDEARQYRIGVVRDDYNHELLKKCGCLRIETASNEMSNTRKFLSGRVDLLPSYELTLAARLKKLGRPFSLVERTLTLIPAEKSKTYMALSRGTDPKLITKIETAFGQVQAEGLIENALRTYLQSIR